MPISSARSVFLLMVCVAVALTFGLISSSLAKDASGRNGTNSGAVAPMIVCGPNTGAALEISDGDILLVKILKVHDLGDFRENTDIRFQAFVERIIRKRTHHPPSGTIEIARSINWHYDLSIREPKKPKFVFPKPGDLNIISVIPDRTWFREDGQFLPYSASNLKLLNQNLHQMDAMN